VYGQENIFLNVEPIFVQDRRASSSCTGLANWLNWYAPYVLPGRLPGYVTEYNFYA